MDNRINNIEFCPRGYYILDPLGDGNQWCPVLATVKSELKNKTGYAKVVTYDERMKRHDGWMQSQGV